MAVKYDPSIESVSYYSTATANQPFIPGGSNAKQGDNPDSGTMAQRKAACVAVSPMATTVKAS